MGLRARHLLGAALVFLCGAAVAAPCTQANHPWPPGGQWQLQRQTADDVLRYLNDKGAPLCESPLHARALTAPLPLADGQHAVVATADAHVLVLPLGGVPRPVRQLQLPGRATAVAVSGPGQPPVIALATDAPQRLVLLSPDLTVLNTLVLRDKSARQQSPVCTLLVSPQRQSFIAVFSAMTELWELSYNPLAPEIGLGMVHDFQYREGQFAPGYLNPQRSALPWVVASSALDVEGHLVSLHGNAAEAPGNGALQQTVVHLDVRKPVPEPVRVTGDRQACGRF